ncbi:hypothetical protein KY092_02740 [Natronomonas gomsonensis]|jgi:hypothetical protein|uniref:hypothetical protein n=1 Tax=Natronomonas gomsonensis TaxID=1046043 RepID=UPI0020CA3B6F|nr:hypothetical protein [Natronomonas gomsonensis]MCY4729473.1 hypothetical protein [Natronomonas gomsonensis]
MNRRTLGWSALAVLCFAFWGVIVIVQRKWANPRAWGAFALGVLIPYWLYVGKLGGRGDGER